MTSKAVTRKIPREVIYEEWGLPYEPDDELGVKILDEVDNGSGRWMSYHSVIFTAPDDGLTYSADYERGLTEGQHCYPWEDYDTVTITQVTNVPKTITINQWIPVKELPSREPRVPTGPELRAQWAQNRADDAAEADWNSWD